jgi:hypothetical protein
MWARRHFPEPAEGTGAAFHTQSRGLQSPPCPTSTSIPFPEDWKKKQKSNNHRPVKKVQLMFRNTGRGK